MEQMTFLQGLQQRVSCAQLAAPAPTAEQLQQMFEAAFRAADHRQLRPWRFLVVEGEGLSKLGELYLAARQQNEPAPTAEERARLLSLPLRAPMLIVAIVNLQEDPKVPEIEQYLSAGAAVQNLLNAAYAQGLGAMWRTGELAFNPHVATGLGLAANEHIIGFVYLGTPRIVPRQPPVVDPANHVESWP